MTRIAIDRVNKAVERVRGFTFCEKREVFQLSRFDTVRLSEQVTTVEEGYGRMWYSVCLEAPGLSVELLSTDDEQHARILHTELTELLVKENRTGEKEIFSKTG